MTEKAGTAESTGEAQSTEQDSPAPAAGTQTQPDEVTTLRSRNAGLDAKVTELSKAAKAAQEAAAAAAQRLADYEAGKVGNDEALRAQLEAKEAELAQVRKEATLARIEARYPETFGVLGEAAAALTADQLAAAEARFAGVAGALPETPKPVGVNPQRPISSGSKAIEDMSAAELRAHLKSFDPSVMFDQR